MVAALLDRLGVNPALYQNGKVPVHSPIDGSQIGAVNWEGAAQVEQHISRADHAFELWRKVPAPRQAASAWACRPGDCHFSWPCAVFCVGL